MSGRTSELDARDPNARPILEAEGGLLFADPRAELGVRRGEVKHTFHYHNSGNAIVEIVSIRPSCTCTVTDLTQKSVEPGDSGELEVTIDLSNQPAGKRQYRVIVSQKNNVQISLQIALEHVPRIHVSPNNVSISFIGNQAKQGIFKLTSYGERPVAIVDTKSSHPAIRVVHEGDPSKFVNGWHHHFVVNVVPSLLPSNRVNSIISVKLDDKEISEVRIPVLVERTARISVYPDVLQLRERVGGKFQSQIVLRDRLGEDIAIESISCLQVKDLTSTFDDGLRRVHNVKFEVPANGVSQTTDAQEVTIRLAKPWRQEIVVPVKFVQE